MAALLAVGGAAGGYLVVRSRAPEPAPVRRVHFELPEPALPTPFHFALSPDATRIAFLAVSADGVERLAVRALDDRVIRALPGTEGARLPFWSPDGESLAFATEGKLKRVDLANGTVRELCRSSGVMPDGTWSREGVILFGSYPGDILRVSAEGGQPARVLAARPSGVTVRKWPRFLPDGRRFLYVDTSRGEERWGLYLASLDDPTPRYVAPIHSATAVGPDGVLLFAAGGALFAQRFDAGAATVAGEPIRIVDDISFDLLLGTAAFSVSRDVLAYRPYGAPETQFVWVDRAGQRIGALGEPAWHNNFDLAPDGRKVIVSIPDRRTRLGALWLLEEGREGAVRISADANESFTDPVFTPDGDGIVYSLQRLRRAVATRPLHGQEESVLWQADAGTAYVEDVSRDGRLLALGFTSDGQSGNHGLLLSLDDMSLRPLGEQTVDEPHFSPDGRLVAYSTLVDDRWEIFLSTVPPGRRRWQLSVKGGVQPRWRPDGRELYFLAPDGALMAAAVEPGADSPPGAPRALFGTGLRPSPRVDQYAVGANGERFLLDLPTDRPNPPLQVIVGWRPPVGGR